MSEHDAQCGIYKQYGQRKCDCTAALSTRPAFDCDALAEANEMDAKHPGWDAQPAGNELTEDEREALDTVADDYWNPVVRRTIQQLLRRLAPTAKENQS